MQLDQLTALLPAGPPLYPLDATTNRADDALDPPGGAADRAGRARPRRCTSCSGTGWPRI